MQPVSGGEHLSAAVTGNAVTAKNPATVANDARIPIAAFPSRAGC
jgi:hypothetical protein